MSTLSTLNTRLSREMSDSETIGKNPDQRNQVINDACERVYKFRNWPELYINTTTQAVDGVINIPKNMDPYKTTALWYGKNTDYYWKGNDIRFYNQTDYFSDRANSATITQENGIQIIKISDPNKGHAVSNTSVTTTIAINDAAAREEVGQTFVMDGTAINGVLAKLSITGSPTGTLTFSIFATAAGIPTGSALATATLNINEIGTSEEWFWVKFTSELSVTDGTTYALTITPSYSADATNYVNWSTNTTSQVDGNQILYNGATWGAGTGDNGFVIASDYYNFQYVQKFVTLENASDDNGLTDEFDQAIAKIAAGLLLKQKGKYQEAQDLLYGSAGSFNVPEPVSGFGILNDLWTNKRIYSARQNKRVKSFYEKSARNYREYWPYDTYSNLL